LYLDLGLQNGMYLTPQQRAQLEKEAALFRKKFDVRPGVFMDLRADQRKGDMGKSYAAHIRVAWCDNYRRLGNYDGHLFEADAQRDPQAILANKLFFNAKRLHRRGESPKALATFEAAVPMWLDLMLRYPNFRSIATVQEDTYEAQLKYIRLLQMEKAGLFRPLMLGMAQLNSNIPWDRLLDANQKAAVIPIRSFRGPLDQILVFSLPNYEEEFKRTLLLWSQAGLPMPMLVYPGQQQRLLATQSFRFEPPRNTLWRSLIGNDIVRIVRGRIPGLRDVQISPPPGPPGMMKMKPPMPSQ
jgi:hypothetical protein